MISKKLLSEVVKDKVEAVSVSEAYVSYWDGQVFVNDLWEEQNITSINIYELAYKCKEWAYNYGYRLNSNINNDGFDGENEYLIWIAKAFKRDFVKTFDSNTEPEAIFKACEWILEQGKQDGKM